MPCPSQVGVKNIVITFRDCDTDETIGPISHKPSGEDLPIIRMCAYTNEVLSGGYVKRTLMQDSIELTVIRDRRVPLAYYQGCAGVDIQIEMWDGSVYSGVNGTVTGEDGSDTHEVSMTIVFVDEIDELLPAGQLQAA